jgi:hypothetical protein
MAQDFQGVLYDIVEEVVIDRAPVVRGTYAEAMADAQAMVKAVNDMAECVDNEADDNSTIGRVDDSYCFVLIDGLIAYSEAEAA